MPIHAPHFNSGSPSTRLQSFPELTPNPGGVALGMQGVVKKAIKTQVVPIYKALPEGRGPNPRDLGSFEDDSTVPGTGGVGRFGDIATSSLVGGSLCRFSDIATSSLVGGPLCRFSDLVTLL